MITLALGIGANTAIFTLVHGILLRSLPVADPSHLYRVGDRAIAATMTASKTTTAISISSPTTFTCSYSSPRQSLSNWLQCRRAGRLQRAQRIVPAKPLRSEFVSGNYFATLGVGAYAGRAAYSPRRQALCCAGSSAQLQSWQTDFAGDPGIVGSTVYVQTHPFTVAGVAPPGFFGDRVIERPPDFWLPLANEPTIEGAGTSLWSQGDEDTAGFICWAECVRGEHRRTCRPSSPSTCANGCHAYRVHRTRRRSTRFLASTWFLSPEAAASRNCSSKPAKACGCS